VPTIILSDNTLLNENAATLQYIADLNPSSGLAPANGTNARYLLQSKLNYISSEVHTGVGALFNSAMSPDLKEFSLKRAAKKLEYLENHELKGKKFIVGDQFSIADSYLYIVLSWTKYVGIDLTPYPAVKTYFEGIGALPYVKEAHAAMEALAKK